MNITTLNVCENLYTWALQGQSVFCKDEINLDWMYIDAYEGVLNLSVIETSGDANMTCSAGNTSFFLPEAMTDDFTSGLSQGDSSETAEGAAGACDAFNEAMGMVSSTTPTNLRH